MNEISLNFDGNGTGSFFITSNNEKVAEMVFSKRLDIEVFHTEVSPAAQGLGLAKKLLGALVAYARSNHYRVYPLCPFVKEQFQLHPEMYSDVWKKD